MDTRNVALVLVVLGTVCIPAPLYFGAAGGADADADRTALVYGADPVNTSDPEDVRGIIDDYSGDVLLDVADVAAGTDAGYRAPEKTRRALRFALQTDTAQVSDPAVKADLRQIDENYDYVYDPANDPGRYYRLVVRSNGSVAQVTNASERKILQLTLESTVVKYEDLTPRERTTFRNILDASRNASDRAGYRPYEGGQLLEHVPGIVSFRGQLYEVRPVDRVDTSDGDDGGPEAPVNPYLISVLGALLAGGGVAYHRSGEDAGE